MSSKQFIRSGFIVLALLILTISNINSIRSEEVPNQVLFTNVNIFDGNPLEDITVIGGKEKWFDAPVRDGIDTMRIIMKDGMIYKNTLL